MADFFLIYVRPRQGVLQAQVQDKMNLARDWFRFDPNVWIVFSTSDEGKWYARLAPLVRQNGAVFICRLDIARSQGWFSKELWLWIRSK